MRLLFQVFENAQGIVEGELNMSRVCPCCGESVSDEHFACRSGAKGGAAGRGESKARTSEQARAAAEARWGKRGKLPEGWKQEEGRLTHVTEVKQ